MKGKWIIELIKAISVVNIFLDFMKIFKAIQVLFFQERAQIYKFFVVGVSGVLLDLGLLFLFSQIVHIWPPFAVVLVQTCVLSYNFLLNKYWAFGVKDNIKSQFWKYTLLVIANYALSFGSMYLFYHIFSFNYMIIRVSTIACIFPFNFLAYKYWVYR